MKWKIQGDDDLTTSYDGIQERKENLSNVSDVPDRSTIFIIIIYYNAWN
jgi:hypothetical protein